MIARAYSTGDPACFGASTITERFPAILGQVIEDLEAAARGVDEPARAEAGQIAKKLRAQIDEMLANKPVEPLNVLDEADKVYNAELAQLSESGPLHYQNAPWLFVECLVYKKVQAFFATSQNWRSYDMFQAAKEGTFAKSKSAVGDLAKRYTALADQASELKSKPLDQQLVTLEVLFHEILQTCLWGNATDLSLLVTIDIETIKKLQVASADRDKESVLVNDFAQVWNQMRTMGGRVDIVLDNAGFEFYTDLVLVLFLLDTGLAEQIVLHPKNIPWFVSDVTPNDWLRINGLLGGSAFDENRESIEAVVNKIQDYQESGQIVMRCSPFWTLGTSFWELKEGGKNGGNEVWKDLRGSKLVIFKGDLNYRKLVGDVEWPRTTPFTEAIRDLSTNGVPMLSLRTIKSDVLVGLQPGVGEKLDAEWAKEHTPKNGWTWGGKWAVVSYSAGK